MDIIKIEDVGYVINKLNFNKEERQVYAYENDMAM